THCYTNFSCSYIEKVAKYTDSSHKFTYNGGGVFKNSILILSTFVVTFFPTNSVYSEKYSSSSVNTTPASMVSSYNTPVIRCSNHKSIRFIFLSSEVSQIFRSSTLVQPTSTES